MAFIPLNLEAAKCGRPLKFRNPGNYHYNVELLSWDMGGSNPLLFRIRQINPDGSIPEGATWSTMSRRLNGREGSSEGAHDIGMEPDKAQLWVNVFPDKSWFSYPTQEAADEASQALTITRVGLARKVDIEI